MELKRIQHLTYHDNRGSYTPISTSQMNMKWDQCSISINTHQFTFRGLHYQTNPPQTKYIKVIQGSIIDFAVDLSDNTMDWILLKDSDAALVPSNCAHGFLTLDPNTIVAYLVEGQWDKDSEHSIPYTNHEEVNKIITRVVGDNKVFVSEKDKLGK